MTARIAFVTGGTGFIGSAIVRALLEEGTRVRALVRAGASRENLQGLDVEVVEGDLGSDAALARGVEGCDEVYHCAALYAFWTRDAADFHRTNVEGTQRVVRVAARAGVARIVQTSSVATVAPIRGRAADETSQARLESAPGHYKRSKILAEREALRLAREEGAPVVVVNPSAPVGPRDVKPTPTGQMILDFLHGRMPAYVDTGLNVVDVEDVGRGHVLAARHGQVGHRYILGGEDMSLRDILLALAGITGLPAPRVRLPHWAASVAAHASETVARLSGSAPRVTVESTRLARHHMYFDSTRARQELAYESRPALVALERAVRWFHDAGRAPPRRSSVTKASGPGT